MERFFVIFAFILLSIETTLTMSTLPASNDASKKNSQPYPKMIPIQGSSKPEYLEDGSTVTRVPGIMNYVTDNTNEVNVYRDVKGHDSEYIGAEWDQVEVPIHNARLFPHTPSLDKEGFELLVKPVTNSVDFFEPRFGHRQLLSRM